MWWAFDEHVVSMHVVSIWWACGENACSEHACMWWAFDELVVSMHVVSIWWACGENACSEHACMWWAFDEHVVSMHVVSIWWACGENACSEHACSEHLMSIVWACMWWTCGKQVVNMTWTPGRGIERRLLASPCSQSVIAAVGRSSERSFFPLYYRIVDCLMHCRSLERATSGPTSWPVRRALSISHKIVGCSCSSSGIGIGRYERWHQQPHIAAQLAAPPSSRRFR